MGTSYYVVIPKLKIMIWIGRNVHEESLEEEEKSMADFFNIWSRYNYGGDLPELYQLKEKKLSAIKVNDLMSIAFYISEIEKFLCLQNSPCTIAKCLIAKRIDKKSYVISDYSEKLGKLKKKNYRVVDEDEG